MVVRRLELAPWDGIAERFRDERDWRLEGRDAAGTSGRPAPNEAAGRVIASQGPH